MTPKPINTAHLAKVMKALSSPKRLELYLDIVKKNESCYKTGSECFLTDIIRSCDLGAPTVSHHLKELTNAGLISTERRGKYLVATVNHETVEEVRALLLVGRQK